MIKSRIGASVVNSVPSGSLITDVEFYSELVDAYNAEKGTTYDYTHNFTEAELASLENLTLDEQGPNYHGHSVESLSGLSYLTGLKNLTLKNMTVTDINLSSNTALISLVIDSVSLTELKLNKNINLDNLEINAPTLNKINLSNTNISNISLSKPTTKGLISVDRETDISYLIGTSSQDESIDDNSFAITCDKYDLAINESTNCFIKGKTTLQMTVMVFNILQDNGNVVISNEQVVLPNVSGEYKYILMGAIPVDTFNIVSFTVTAVSNGTTKIYLGDYSNQNKLSYIADDEHNWDPYYIEKEISKTFTVGKYAVTDATDNVVSSGNLVTNYKLKMVNNAGTYDDAYDIAVLGDVFADGMVNVRDLAKAYTGLSKPNQTGYRLYTPVEIAALDINCDGVNNILDLGQIYLKME